MSAFSKFKLTRLKIPQKFGVMGAALGFTILVVAGTYFFSSSVFHHEVGRQKENTEHAGLFSDIFIKLEGARLDVAKFLAKPDQKWIDARRSKMKVIDNHLTRLADEAHEQSERELTLKARDQLRFNQGLVDKTFEMQAEIGFDQNKGIQGAFRKQVHSVEDAVNKHNQPELLASMLMMRRHEKDYLLRGDSKYIKKHDKEWADFQRLLARSSIQGASKARILALGGEYSRGFHELTEKTEAMLKNNDEFAAGFAAVDPILAQLKQIEDTQAAEDTAASEKQTTIATYAFYGVLVVAAIALFMMAFMIVRNILQNLGSLQGAVTGLAEGRMDARANVKSGDELQELGDAFDRMIEERGKFMQTEEENERMNNSVIAILRAVSQLGKGDLTIAAPVAEDITGALADAINQMKDNIANTLGQVNAASGQVLDASGNVRNITEESKNTVLGTVQGMGEIRNTIQETAKRIKRLGERSQEISGIVKLIDTIAERTNVLALNANMQAAQAGDAGRGFMVVADEVQRLAESAKEATDQISKLVGNIQVETGDTIATMDKAIEEVVRGGALAEQAAGQMNRTEEMVRALNALGDELQKAVGAFSLPASAVAASSRQKAA